MSLVRIKPELTGLIQLKVHRFATLWRIERQDAVVLRFTDHDAPLRYAYAASEEVYTPAGAFDASARERLAGMQDTNLESQGMLDSDAITDDDLRAGLYEEAKVIEILVDWRVPYAGAFQTNVYWVAGVSYTQEVWSAQLSTQPVWLRKENGTVLTTGCRHVLGQGICGQGVNLEDFKIADVAVDTVQEIRRVFTSTTLTQETNWFTYGHLVWKTGANIGRMDQIALFVLGGEVQLTLNTSYDITAGDTYDIFPGCDKTLTTCKIKYDNVVNNGGFPGLPGTDKIVGGLIP